MKLVFLYGPPGVGKLTVAKELATLTGFKLLHNHLVLDLAETLFERNSDAFKESVKKLRLMLIETASKTNEKGLIMTYTFVDTPSHNAFIKQLVKSVDLHGGEACFVRLHCDKSTLMKRVVSASRKKHGKISDAKKLELFLREHDAHVAIPKTKSFSVDTTSLTAKEAAKEIRAHYRL